MHRVCYSACYFTRRKCVKDFCILSTPCSHKFKKMTRWPLWTENLKSWESSHLLLCRASLEGPQHQENLSWVMFGFFEKGIWWWRIKPSCVPSLICRPNLVHPNALLPPKEFWSYPEQGEVSHLSAETGSIPLRKHLKLFSQHFYTNDLQLTTASDLTLTTPRPSSTYKDYSPCLSSPLK